MKFKCVICDYSTSRRDNFKKHLSTAKHKRLTEAKIGLTKVGKLGEKVGKKAGKVGKCELKCEFCGKIYIHRQSLFKHKKKKHNFTVKKYNEEVAKQIEQLKKELEKQREELEKEKNNEEAAKQIEQLKKELEKQREELEKEKSAHIETQKKALLEKQQNIEVTQKLAARPTQQIFCFLNNDCMNAIPLMEFIENLKFKITDINPNNPSSSIKSLSNVVVNSLNMLEDTERPIHCSDAKRLKFYVKDASDGWIEDKNNQKMDKAIGWANMRHQGAWHTYAKTEGLDKKRRDTNYLKMNVAMAKFSDDKAKAKKKVKRAIALATPLKEAQNSLTDS